ncbi:MAG: OB-fold nucleic acid binding domain-containing protein, partial [Thermoproteota archaeon]|nr:OB-fold nucleic acid binding domain-containing protein [Thermoproteota archaeon]
MNELLQEIDLGTWRRTHYSKEITLSMEANEEVVIMGWVASKRDHGNIQFIILRDMYGEIQVTVKKRECSDSLFQLAKEVKEHSSIGVRGRARPQEKVQNGVEVVPLEIRIFSMARKAAPFLVQSRTSTVGIDTRLDLRAVDLRRNYLRSIFRIRQTVLSSVREFLLAQKFVEVNTPKMIATATEGGAALFPIFYYDREAFLAQSPQLYKEQLTMAFENIFEIGPIFRAEPSRTNRHLSEAISIDVECAFVDYNDVMSLLERMVSKIVDTLKEKNQDELEYLHLQLPSMDVPFSKYRYSYIVDRLQEAGERIQWGDDLSPQIMKSIKNEHFDDFYFIIDWPTS